MKVHSWGRLGRWPHETLRLADASRPLPFFSADKKGLAYGNGRSYGDVGLNPDGGLWLTSGLDHFLSFDDQTGILVCEPGLLLRDIQQLLIPRGWMLPVTPGTQLVTVGGAIANDVHGKNHHVHGSFGNHVLQLRLRRTDGEVIDCGPELRPDWFAATVGGMGLTGVIVQATLQLRRVPGAWLETESRPYEDFDRFFLLSDSSEADWEYTVSWIDCISSRGRGIFMRGNHTAAAHPEPHGRKLAVPIDPPFSLINRASLRPFNVLYYRLQARHAGRRLTHYAPFFYPLDNILEWNRIYGPRGFYQYQSVVPREAGQYAVQAMLREITRAGDGSFLGVLKTFGNRTARGMLSFPCPGVTLALDFPNKGERTLRLFDRLDAIVRETGGRLYAAKDARMPRDLFESGYPRLAEFLQYRDPGISSSMSRRLMGY